MNCNHDKTVCPEHDGGYDCTPFCRTCEGEQEYCPQCDPIETETGYVTYSYDPPILSHKHYRFVCDHCEWVSHNHGVLSEASRELAEHARSEHETKPRSDTPAPLSPSKVLELIRK